MQCNSPEESLHSLANCIDLARLEDKLKPFNIFELLQLGHLELVHSSILAWLFDPSQSHGPGDLFLKRWLTQVLRDSEPASASTCSPVDVDKYSLKAVEVLAEWNYIDLLIKIGYSHESCMREEQRFVIAHYIQLLNHRFMANSEIETLARNIYAAHKQALDIISYFGFNSVLKVALEKEIQERNLLYLLKPVRKNLIDLLPKIWNSPPAILAVLDKFLCEIRPGIRKPRSLGAFADHFGCAVRFEQVPKSGRVARLNELLCVL
jgi:PD-(D/E)XK nuclease superfamily